MFEKTFLREQFKKKEYLKKRQEEKEKSQLQNNRDNSQPNNIPERHKVRVMFGRAWRRRQRLVGTAPVPE